MKKLVIKWKPANSFSLPPAASELAAEKQGLVLLPGENSVSESYWNEVKSNPSVKIQLRKKILINEGEGKAKPLARDFSALTIEEVEKMVGRLSDVESVEKVKKSVNKAGAVKACDDRIKAIEEHLERANV
jgi:hypothetical protein